MSDLDPSSAPEITLRGKTYKLPELELKQVIPLTSRFLKLRGANFTDLTEDQLWLLFDVAFIALGFVEPSITREEFDRSPPTYQELLSAFPIIIKQGRFQIGVSAAAAPKGDGTAGEQTAESSQSGMTS